VHPIVDEGSLLADAFEAHGTPSAVLVDDRGAVASWVAAGAEAIEQLVHGVTRPAPVEIGDPAPEVQIETIDGAPFSLAQVRGTSVAVVFWNPECGFCREMHDDLREHEATVDGKGPALVIASSGGREATAAEGFSSTVLLDRDQVLASAFGAHGTPMAVLLTADGTVASRVAAGADAVTDLLDRRNSR
jgi:peroxiredoxin